MITVKRNKIHIPIEYGSALRGYYGNAWVKGMLSEETESEIILNGDSDAVVCGFMGRSIAIDIGPLLNKQIDYCDEEAEQIVALFEQRQMPWPTNPAVLMHAARYLYLKQEKREIMHQIVEQLYWGLR